MQIRTPDGRFEHRPIERRAITATSTFAGWNDSLSVTGVVPPHGYDFLNRAGVNVTPKTVLSIGVVQRCLEVIQNATFVMGSPRPYTRAFHKASGMRYREWIPDGTRSYPAVLDAPWGTTPFADKAPVPYNVGAGRTTTSMGLFGEAWWLTISRDTTTGRPSALEVLHPSFVTMEVTPNAAKLKTIWYGMGSKRVELTPADLIHIPRLILPGDRSGVNPIKSESPMFAIAIAAVQYSQMWFAQGATPSYVLSTPQRLGDEEIDRIFEKLLLEHSGLNKAHTPLILDSGVEPKTTQIDPTKSQMNETLQYIRSEQAGYFGIPLHLVGATGDSGNVWGKGIQEENIGLEDFTLSGYRVPMEEAFSSILPKGIRAAVNQKALRKSADLTRSKLVLSNRQGAVTMPNEERMDQTFLPLTTESANSITTPMNANIPAPSTAGGMTTAGAGSGTAGGGTGGE